MCFLAKFLEVRRSDCRLNSEKIIFRFAFRGEGLVMLVWTKLVLSSLDHAPTELFTLDLLLFLYINYLPSYFYDNLLHTDT